MDQKDTPYQTALAFHGHKCPAMPIGLRAGLVAMKRLGVERASNKELRVEAETGEGHAMGCFLDGVMSATGCTYGKGNVRKLGFHKLAFSLIDIRSSRSVRVVVQPEVIEAGLAGPFVVLRKQGIAPRDIAGDVVNPLVDGVLTRAEEELFDVGDLLDVAVSKPSSTFGLVRCAHCGEAVFLGGARLGGDPETTDRETLCIPCSGYAGAKN